MPDPTTVDFWYKESDCKLTNGELFVLYNLLTEANSYHKSFLYDSERSKLLQSKIAHCFIESGMRQMPENLATF